MNEKIDEFLEKLSNKILDFKDNFILKSKIDFNFFRKTNLRNLNKLPIDSVKKMSKYLAVLFLFISLLGIYLTVNSHIHKEELEKKRQIALIYSKTESTKIANKESISLQKKSSSIKKEQEKIDEINSKLSSFIGKKENELDSFLKENNYQLGNKINDDSTDNNQKIISANVSTNVGSPIKIDINLDDSPKQVSSKKVQQAAEESARKAAEESSKKEQAAADAASRAEAEKNKVVTYTVNSKYNPGTIGYAIDEKEAKKNAIKQQAPSQYNDYVWLLSFDENLDFAMEWVYADVLEGNENPAVTKDEAKQKVQTNVNAAKEYEKRLNTVVETVNNSDEYNDVKQKIQDVLADEPLLSK
jgi:hypothetical protein